MQGTFLRPEIEQSWRRSRLAGLNPEDHLRVDMYDYEESSRLIRAAEPVLAELNHQLSDISMGCLLADRQAVVVRRYFGDAAIAGSFDAAGVDIGTMCDESRAGTNALATPLETRQPILIGQGEHYLHSLQKYVCYGAPIFSPITRRLEGVLDLMAPVGTDTALMTVVIDRAVRDIEQRLVDRYDENLAASVAVFNALRKNSTDALVLIGENMVMQNARSVDLLGNDDFVSLTALVDSAGVHPSTDLTLSNGTDVRVKARVIGRQSAVFQLRVADVNTPQVPRGRNSRQSRAGCLAAQLRLVASANGHVLITGESGSGRTTAGRQVSGLDAVTVDLTTAPDDVSQIIEAAGAGKGFVIVEGLAGYRLSQLDQLSQILKSTADCRIIVTACAVNTLPQEAAELASHCLNHVELPPLRDYGDGFGQIVDVMLRELGATTSRLTLAAMEVLRGRDWPGNFVELRLVLTDALRHRAVGDITPADLPARYRAKPARPNITPLERAERDTITRALSHNSGNKARTAEELGVSRSTLYLRLRYFGVQ